MSSSKAGDENADLLLDLVLSVLAVNQYSLERTYASRQGLVKELLINPESLAEATVDDLVDRLCRAGYDRGPYMTRLFAGRLRAVGAAFSGESANSQQKTLGSGDRAEIEKLLMPIGGVGPRVVENFLILRGL